MMASALLLLATGCSRSEAPSEELEAAAEEVVAAVEGEPAPPAGNFAPRNTCDALPGSAEFLGELGAAVAARDVDALAALAAQDIKLDFGGGSGVPELRRRLAGDGGALWDELEALTRLGCAANSQGGITLPWYFEQQIAVSDPTAGFIALGQDVPLRGAPAADAPVLARLDWAAVEQVPADGGRDGRQAGFRHVRLLPTAGIAGTGDAAVREQPVAGYVAEEALRSLIDHRLIAASRNGRWRIIALVAGD